MLCTDHLTALIGWAIHRRLTLAQKTVSRRFLNVCHLRNLKMDQTVHIDIREHFGAVLGERLHLDNSDWLGSAGQVIWEMSIGSLVSLQAEWSLKK